jgi:hypothetical protein
MPPRPRHIAIQLICATLIWIALTALAVFDMGYVCVSSTIHIKYVYNLRTKTDVNAYIYIYEVESKVIDKIVDKYRDKYRDKHTQRQTHDFGMSVCCVRLSLSVSPFVRVVCRRDCLLSSICSNHEPEPEPEPEH